MVDAKRALLALSVALGACGEDAIVETAIDLTFVPGEGVTVDSGGYQVSIRETNGTPIEGIDDFFVPFVAGEQTVRLAVDDLRSLGDNRRVSVRIAAQAVVERDGIPTAFGSVAAVFEEDAVNEAMLELGDTPPVTSDDLRIWLASAPTTAGFAAPRDALRLAWESDATEISDDLALHAWAVGDSSVEWLGLVANSGSTTLEGLAGSAALDPAAVFAVSAEDASLTSELVVPMGPVMFVGNVNAAVASVLNPRLAALDDLAKLLTAAELHTALAAAAPTNVGNVQQHTEHVANVLSSGASHDFNGTGGAEDPVNFDMIDVAEEDPTVLLNTIGANLSMIIEGSNDFSVSAILGLTIETCAGASGMVSLLSDAVNAAEVFSTSPTESDLATLEAALVALMGSEDPASGFACLRAGLEEAGSFHAQPQL
jgi:hypothetical protein